MVVDIGAGVIVVLMGYFGYVTGAAFQLIRLTVLAGAGVMAYFVGREMAIFHLGKSPELAPADAATYWFFICLAVLWGLGTVGVKTLEIGARDASVERTAGDAIGGAFCGAARGFAIAFMLVIGMWSLNQTQQRFDLPYEKSYLAHFAIPKSFLQTQTEHLRKHLEEHDTTEAPEDDDRVQTVGDLPKDERSVLP